MFLTCEKFFLHLFNYALRAHKSGHKSKLELTSDPQHERLGTPLINSFIICELSP